MDKNHILYVHRSLQFAKLKCDLPNRLVPETSLQTQAGEGTQTNSLTLTLLWKENLLPAVFLGTGDTGRADRHGGGLGAAVGGPRARLFPVLLFC